MPKAKAPFSPESAHVNLMRALTALAPARIVGKADACDVQARTDHIRAVYHVAIRYLEQLVQDTTDHLPGRIDCGKADLILWDGST